MNNQKDIKRKIVCLTMLLILFVPTVSSILDSGKTFSNSKGELHSLNNKNVLKTSNGNSINANDFKLKTEWIKNFGTVDEPNLPYRETTKSFIGDFNGDGSEDFIFTDGATIWVIDINGSIIFRYTLVPGKVYTDMDIGNLSSAPGVDIAIVANDSIVILSYPGIDITTFGGAFHSIQIANINPNNPYDEIIATNYSSYFGGRKSSTVFTYNATGELLWTFTDEIHPTRPCIFNIESGHDLDGDGKMDDIAAFSANNNIFRNVTIWAINETGDLIYSWTAEKNNPSSFADYAIGNFNATTPADEICFTAANYPRTIMLRKPQNANQNATVDWYYDASQTYDILEAGDNLIENSGTRDDLLFGYASVNNYVIEIRNGSNGSTLNWSISAAALQNVIDPQISIGDLDGNNKDEVIIGDSAGYLTMYETPGVFKWKVLLGSTISIVNNRDVIGDLKKEIIVHPVGHLILLQNNSTKLLDIGNSKILYTLLSNLDSDVNKEIIAFFQDNRIIAVDNDGSKLWEYLSPIPIIEVASWLPGLLGNKFALMDKDNDGIDEYLYITSGQFGSNKDYILDISGSEPIIAYSGLQSGLDVKVGDFDRDGLKDDFVVVGFNLEVFTDSFSGIQPLWEKSFQVGVILNFLWECTVGDFNGDGYDDIACSFWSYNTVTPQLSPTNTTLMAFNGLSGAQIFRYDNLNGTRGMLSAGDLNSDGTDEVVVGYPIYMPNGNVTVIKRSGSTGILMWKKVLSAATKEIKIGEFTNDSKLDVAVMNWANELRIYNASNGNLLGQYDGLSHVNIVSGQINNENRDQEIISGSPRDQYSTANVFTRNYSQALPQTLGITEYPVYLDGYISNVQAGNVTGGSRDNIILGTEKGSISCLISFEEKELKDMDLKVSLQNKTCIAGEYIDVYFEIERNEPDILKKIDISMYEWGTGKQIASYMMEDSLKDLRIEPGITKVKARFLVPIQAKGKYYISGNVFLDNLTNYDIFNNAFETPCTTEPFDVLGKTIYTYIEAVDIPVRNIEYLNYVELNITLKNTQFVSDTLNLSVSATVDNFIINQTVESLTISANSQRKLERKILVPYEKPSDLLAIISTIYVKIEGNQGVDAITSMMELSDANGAFVGYYYNTIEIFNETNRKIVELDKDNVSSYILQINRSASKVVENFSMIITYYNNFNFPVYIGGMYLTNDFDEEPTLISNDTKQAGASILYGDNPISQPGKSEMQFNLNFSFAQAENDGIHSMFLILLAINLHTFRLESCGFEIKYNLTRELNNTLYFTDEFSISNAIVQCGQDISATAVLNFTAIPVTGANVTAIIHILDVANQSHYFNVTKVVAISGLSTIEINMSISTELFNDTLIALYLGILDENFSKIIVPWIITGINGAIIKVIAIEKSGIYRPNIRITNNYNLKFGNAAIKANFTQNVLLSVNSFTSYRNPASAYISELVSENLYSVGFWTIEANITLLDSYYNENINITLYYLPDSAFAQRVHEQNLIPYYFNKTTRLWQSISIFTLRPNENSISFTMPHLSDFAIGGMKDNTSPLVQITTTFNDGKTNIRTISINWQSTFADWASYWTRYSLYLDNQYLNGATNNSQTITLPAVEKLYTIKVVGYDIFNNSDYDDVAVWLDLSKLVLISISDDVQNNGDLPSTGYLKLTWQGISEYNSSYDLLYYIIIVNGETLNLHYTGTSYEFIFTEDGTYEIQIIGVDGNSDQTVLYFNVNYEAPEEVSESSEEIDSTVLTIVIGATVIISVLGIVLLIIRKDKTVDYSKVKNLKK